MNKSPEAPEKSPLHEVVEEQISREGSASVWWDTVLCQRTGYNELTPSPN